MKMQLTYRNENHKFWCKPITNTDRKKMNKLNFIQLFVFKPMINLKLFISNDLKIMISFKNVSLLHCLCLHYIIFCRLKMGTRVYLWWIHDDIWQNQYNIVKLKNKIKNRTFFDNVHKMAFSPFLSHTLSNIQTSLNAEQLAEDFILTWTRIYWYFLC